MKLIFCKCVILNKDKQHKIECNKMQENIYIYNKIKQKKETK